MLFDRPIKLRAIHLPILSLLLPTFALMHSTEFCLLPLLITFHGGSVVSLSVGAVCQILLAWVIAAYALIEFG